MSLKSLLEALEKRAEAEREKILSRARERAGAILADAREAARERRAEYLGRVEREARARARRRGAEARREARGRVLSARAEALERVFEEARGHLADAVGSGPFREALPGVLASALRHVGGAEIGVRCSPGSKGAIEEALAVLEASSDDPSPDAGTGPGRVGEVAEDGSVEAGFWLVGEDGELIVDGSLYAAMRRLRPRLSIELVTRVEGEGSLPTLDELAPGSGVGVVEGPETPDAPEDAS